MYCMMLYSIVYNIGVQCAKLCGVEPKPSCSRLRKAFPLRASLATARSMAVPRYSMAAMQHVAKCCMCTLCGFICLRLKCAVVGVDHNHIGNIWPCYYVSSCMAKLLLAQHRVVTVAVWRVTSCVYTAYVVQISWSAGYVVDELLWAKHAHL